jgi:uncharacterized protein (DUF885 family)
MEKEFDMLQETFIAACFDRHPEVASYLGFTEYDTEIPSGKLSDRKKEINQDKEFLENFMDIDETKIDFDRKITRKLAIHKLRIWIFVDETLQHYLMNPSAAGEVASFIHSLYRRPGPEKFYPLQTRLEKIPFYIQDFKTRVVTPVALWTDMSIEEAEGVLNFLPMVAATSRKEIPPRDAEEIENSLTKVEHSLKEYITFLKQVLPAADTPWVMGRENFENLLALRDIPYTGDQILELGNHWIQEEKEKIEKMISSVYPGKSIGDIVEEVKSQHPQTFEETLELYRFYIKKSKEFVIKNDIITIPEGEDLVVEETPEYLAFMYPVALYVPAPAVGKERTGHYNVTPPKNQDMLREHNNAAVANISVHEAYPGHHIQFFCSYNHPHKIRWGFTPTDVFAKYVSDGTEFVEGWAHYCEDYMVERGFETSKEYLFVQSLHSLFRAARTVVDVRLSRGEITLDEAATFLEKETGIESYAAAAEVKRYTLGPSYPLSYLLGKYMIKELKKKVRQAAGPQFSDRLFHDTIVNEGTLPVVFLDEVLEHKICSG